MGIKVNNLRSVKNRKITFLKTDEEYKEFPCDLCGSTDAVEIPYIRKYTNGQLVHICKKCGLIYAKRRRSYDKIAQVWSNELFGKAYTSKIPLMLARHTYIAEFVDQEIGLRNKLVCDIGAGEGQFLSIVKRDYGSRVFGIEPSRKNCKRMNKMRIDCFDGALEDYIADPKRKKCHADIATIMWTLENATSCKDILMGARQILKTNGYLIVATGSRILVPFTKPLHFYLNSYPIDFHPVRFSLNTLSSLLAATGFKVSHINPYLNDGLLLCVIAKKTRINKNIKIKNDDYRCVRDFFKRWHKESRYYPQNKSS